MRQEFGKLRFWAAPLLHWGPQTGDCFLGGGRRREGVAQANLLRRPTPPPGALPNPAFYGEEVKPSGLGADERGWGPLGPQGAPAWSPRWTRAGGGQLLSAVGHVSWPGSAR